jgi:hypothetical protein
MKLLLIESIKNLAELQHKTYKEIFLEMLDNATERGIFSKISFKDLQFVADFVLEN